MLSDVEQARFICMEAEQEIHRKEKFSLYISASKLYLKAASKVEDKNIQSSLLFLASSCAYKADLVTSKSSTLKSVLLIPKNSEKLNNLTVECADVYLSDRLILLTHQNRNADYQQISKTAGASPSEIAKDLFNMESRLADIGLKKDGIKALTDVMTTSIADPLQHSIYVPNERQNTRFTSDLGESFMLLDPKSIVVGNNSNSMGRTLVQSSTTMRPPPADNIANKQNMSANGTRSQHTLQVERSLNNRQQHHQEFASTRSSVNTCSSNSNATSLQGPAAASKTNNTSTDADSHITASSMLDNSSSQSKKTVAISDNSNNNSSSSVNNHHQQQQHRRSNRNDAVTVTTSLDNSTIRLFDELSQSTIRVLDKESAGNAEGVIHLLQTVKTLSDENAMLIRKNENLRCLEQQSLQAYQDIELFKKDYMERFRSLKALLTKYAHSNSIPADMATTILATPPPPPPPVLTTVAATTSSSLTSNDLKTKTETTGSVSKEEEERQLRQRQLEKMVKALVARLEKANNDIKAKDDLLNKYTRMINALQKQHHPTSESASSIRSLNNTDSSNTIVSSDIPINNNNPNTSATDTKYNSQNSNTVSSSLLSSSSSSSSSISNKSGIALSGANNNSNVVAPIGSPGKHSSSSSSSTMASLITMSQQQQQQLLAATVTSRKQLVLPPRSKHHSTSTMEVLQRSATSSVSSNTNVNNAFR